MSHKLVDLIAGARPNFVKIAAIIDAFDRAIERGSRLRYRLIHTGQHYDRVMSDSFFEQLRIPKPSINLGVGSGTQAEQTGAIMVGYEKVLMQKSCDACLVVGDVTSTMACSIVARKHGIPVGHVEGGIRSGDWTMPEEINRVVTDSITNWFFTTSDYANQNLLASGVDERTIFMVGNTMITTLLKHRQRFVPPQVWVDRRLCAGKYLVLTLHRPSNVDDHSKLFDLIDTILGASNGMEIIFPAHPRTAKMLQGASRALGGIELCEPLSYLEFNYLVERSKGVITDSGGITEEATVLGVPCITLRENTERPETVTMGTNELVGTDSAAITGAMTRLRGGKWKKGGVPELWDEFAGERIVSCLEELL